MEFILIVAGRDYSVPLWLVFIICALALVGLGSLLILASALLPPPKTLLSMSASFIGWRALVRRFGRAPDMEAPSRPHPRGG